MEIVVHGGAGRIHESRHDACRAGCVRAAVAGWDILAAGGRALDAVEAAVRVLEDDPEFNAGTGAVLRADGRVQLDAAVMDGPELAFGAVAAIERIRNPVTLARRVLEDGRHALLAGEDAQAFAREQGFALCDPQALIVERERAHWERRHGTVGCVARDRAGRIAAATSTGGQSGALPGRVGDSPLPGCGTYADGIAGVSCTGPGEAIMRVVLARFAAERMAAGAPAAAAGRAALAHLRARTGADAGLIAIDRDGRIGHAHTTPHMPVAWRADGGRGGDAIGAAQGRRVKG